MIPDELVFSLMGLFIGQQEDWKMVELSGFKIKLEVVNANYPPVMAPYLYSNLVYFLIYGMIKSYQNYFNWLKTRANSQFNKAMSRLRIEVKHRFTIY